MSTMISNKSTSSCHDLHLDRIRITNDCVIKKNKKIILNLSEKEYVEFEWGEIHEIGSAAYWTNQAKQLPNDLDFSSGRSLIEEVVFCLLGGHGIPAEIAIAAFNLIHTSGIISNNYTLNRNDLEDILKRPIWLEKGSRFVHYRFPAQKSRVIYNALQTLYKSNIPSNKSEIRNYLLKISGIGPKTASWIIRNHFGSDEVAIIDVHVRRAGEAAGFFRSDWKLPKHYNLFEKVFIFVASVGNVRPALLDACIWDQMRQFGRLGRNLLQ